MKIPKQFLDRFTKMYQADTGKKLDKVEAIAEFNKLISFVKLGIEKGMEN